MGNYRIMFTLVLDHNLSCSLFMSNHLHPLPKKEVRGEKEIGSSRPYSYPLSLILCTLKSWKI